MSSPQSIVVTLSESAARCLQDFMAYRYGGASAVEILRRALRPDFTEVAFDPRHLEHRIRLTWMRGFPPDLTDRVHEIQVAVESGVQHALPSVARIEAPEQIPRPISLDDAIKRLPSRQEWDEMKAMPMEHADFIPTCHPDDEERLKRDLGDRL